MIANLVVYGYTLVASVYVDHSGLRPHGLSHSCIPVKHLTLLYNVKGHSLKKLPTSYNEVQAVALLCAIILSMQKV